MILFISCEWGLTIIFPTDHVLDSRLLATERRSRSYASLIADQASLITFCNFLSPFHVWRAYRVLYKSFYRSA